MHANDKSISFSRVRVGKEPRAGDSLTDQKFLVDILDTSSSEFTLCLLIDIR